MGYPADSASFSPTCEFDWYQATVHSSVPALCDLVLRSHPAPLSVIDGNGMNGFKQRKDFCLLDEVVFTVLHGGQNPFPEHSRHGRKFDSSSGYASTV